MAIRLRYLTSIFLACVGGAHSQTPNAGNDLVGDWACYGYSESESGMYTADYSIVHAADGSWRSEGQFGSLSESTGLMPYDWDYSATGSWSLKGDTLVYSLGGIRFLPTRGGADYEATDPRTYLRIPVRGTWNMNMPEPIFMTLESENDSLLFECDKQVFD